MNGTNRRYLLAKRPTGPSLAEQLKMQDEQLIGQRYRNLLDFESASDAVFISSPQPQRIAKPHTGKYALQGTGELTIKLDALLDSATLPGDWTLIGIYVRSANGGDVSASLVADNTVISAIASPTRTEPGLWQFVAIDLTQIKKDAFAGRRVNLRIEGSGVIDIDDLLLVNNRQTLVQTTGPLGWTVTRSGLWLTAQWPDGKSLRFAVPGEFTIEEANSIRVRLGNGRASVRERIIYCDQRVINDAVLAGNYTGPTGEITVDESSGRLNRTTPGDADNDGYNERHGAYQLIAKQPRMTLKLTPHAGKTVLNPVIEINGITGPLVAMIEGTLHSLTASPNSTSHLILIPLHIERTTTITIRPLLK